MATWGTGVSLKGIDGSKIFFITGTPTDAGTSSRAGDVAFATDTNLIYQRGADGWPADGTSLRGAMGLTGVNGASFYSGPNAPDASVSGNDGDLFLAMGTGEIFKHANGAWEDQGYSILGAKGSDGAAGARGSINYFGHGAPPSDLSTLSPAPQSGDVYYDLDGGPTIYPLNP